MSSHNIHQQIDKHLAERLHERLLRNYASALIRMSSINPAGQDLVIALGTGFESSNFEALINWVREHPDQFYLHDSQASGLNAAHDGLQNLLTAVYS